MKTTLAVVVVCALALTVSQSGAAVVPIEMSLADLEVNGWKVTVKDGPEAGASVSEAQTTLRKLAAVFGLRLDGPIEPRVIEGWNSHYQRFL